MLPAETTQVVPARIRPRADVADRAVGFNGGFDVTGTVEARAVAVRQKRKHHVRRKVWRPLPGLLESLLVQGQHGVQRQFQQAFFTHAFGQIRAERVEPGLRSAFNVLRHTPLSSLRNPNWFQFIILYSPYRSFLNVTAG